MSELIRDYVELVWNQGRTDLAAHFVAEDLAQHNPSLPDGRAALVAFIDGFRANLPAGRFEIRRLAQDGDLVFTHSHFATEPGDTGVAVVDVYRVVDGVIVEHWDVKEAVPDVTASGRPTV
jgi:predicted SnoaL-like aldol condensation-catalyzing enzyme